MIHSRLVLAVLIVVGTGAASAQEAAWPGFRGPRGDGIARGGNPPLKWGDGENVRWRTKLPGPGSSSPVILGDKVYVACYSGYGNHLDDGGDHRKLQHHLVCVARSSGAIQWNCTIPGPLEKEARRVVIVEHGFASPTPITDGVMLYAYFGRAGVVAVDLEGKLVWQTDLGHPSPDAPAATNSVERNGKKIPLRWGSAASPILHDGLVIVNASEESNSVRALDAKTGKLVWKRESANLEGCAIAPVIVGAKTSPALIMVLAGEVWALEPKTGELRWRVPTDTSTGMCPTPVSDDTLVYTFGGGGSGYALRHGEVEAKAGDVDGAQARIAWRGPNSGIPSPLLHDGKIFLIRDRGMASCLSAASGEVLFEGRLDGRPGGVYASPTLAGGRIYVVSRKQGTFVYSADGEFELLAKSELDDSSQFNGSPAHAGDEIYLRSDESLYCLASSDE